MNEPTKMVSVLVIVSLLSAASLSFVYEKASPLIEEKNRGELKRSLQEVTPTADRFDENNELNNLISDGREGIRSIYGAYQNNEKIGMALLIDTIGFGGTIRILVGIDIKTDEITGIKILQHLETPGLGERIAKPEFLNQFIAKTIELNTKDIDSITGATISSTAVIRAITLNLEKISPYIKKDGAILNNSLETNKNAKNASN